MKRFLILGYGNTLRSDDGLGPHIVERLAHTRMPQGADVHTLCLPQLDIALVSCMAHVDVVIFVDARQDEDDTPVRVARIESSQAPPGPGYTTHSVGIPALLGIVQRWYGKVPHCFAVMPKGYEFGIGEHFSRRGRLAAKLAVSHILLKVEELVAGSALRHVNEYHP